MTTLAPTLSTRYFPRSAAWLRDLLLITISALFVAALAQVRIPLPFTPVPITGQTFAVLLVGAALAGLHDRPHAGISGRVRCGGLCRGSAGRTRPGAKRAHFLRPVPGWDPGHLSFRRGLAGHPVWDRAGADVRHTPVFDR